MTSYPFLVIILISAFIFLLYWVTYLEKTKIENIVGLFIAIIMAIAFFLFANQPVINIESGGAFNTSTGSLINEIYVQNSGEMPVTNFQSELKTYLYLTVNSDGKVKNLFIPVYNLYGNPLYTGNRVGYLVNYSITDLNKSNDQFGEKIKEEYANFSKTHNYDSSGRLYRIIEVKYHGNWWPFFDDFWIVGTTTKIHSIDPKCISKTSAIDFMKYRMNENDQQFEMWINESNKTTFSICSLD